MKSKLTIPVVLAAGGGLAACGSSGSAPPPPSHGLGRPVRSYHVALTGKGFKPAGAPRGSGAAAVALHHRAVVCFRFAHLHGFSGATTAQIGQGAKGKVGKAVLELSRGHTLRHKGCVRASRALGAGLQRTPSSYYVVVNSKTYPKGAVRGQL